MSIHSFSKHTEFSGVEEKMEIVKNEYLKMYFSTVFSYFPPLIDHQRLFKSTKTAVIAVLLLSHISSVLLWHLLPHAVHGQCQSDLFWT